MASRTLKGKSLINKIRKANRRLASLESRYAIMHNKVNSQKKLVDQLVSKIPKEDMALYKEQIDKLKPIK